MPSPHTVAGFEGLIYAGTAGVTAATLLTNVENLFYSTAQQTLELTPRSADGVTPPVTASCPVSFTVDLRWSMVQKTSDNNLVALIAAARSGKPVAIRTKSYASGLGYDGDCTLSVENRQDLKGISYFDFSAKPFDQIRYPKLNV